MTELYWICFLGGAAFAVALVLFDAVAGGWIDGVLDALPDALHPIAVVGGIVAFGGAGILLSTYTLLGAFATAAVSAAAAALLAVGLFFFYVKPMSEAEHSIAYSMQELTGKIGEVSVPIPVGGYGEVGFTFGHGMVYHIADTSEREPLPAGEKVLAIEVKDGVVTVCRWTED
ncbi:protease [Paenibacillus sp.]|uniref:protease n=1 Tax=Paenibacillus sp. TaxID=58172 RepID=UPI002D5129A7|nr:protease [Paenibacillus sp.]HZG56977.1 protease [Paenibacillus sp.]